MVYPNVIRTGFSQLDKLLNGGLKDGAVVELVGPASTGKALLAHTVLFRSVLDVKYGGKSTRERQTAAVYIHGPTEKYREHLVLNECLRHGVANFEEFKTQHLFPVECAKYEDLMFALQSVYDRDLLRPLAAVIVDGQRDLPLAEQGIVTRKLRSIALKHGCPAVYLLDRLILPPFEKDPHNFLPLDDSIDYKLASSSLKDGCYTKYCYTLLTTTDINPSLVNAQPGSPDLTARLVYTHCGLEEVYEM